MDREIVEFHREHCEVLLRLAEGDSPLSPYARAILDYMMQGNADGCSNI